MKMVMQKHTILLNQKFTTDKHTSYQAIDSVISTINDRFNQADYGIYTKLEQILLQAATNNNYSTELKEVVEFHKDDFNSLELEIELEIFSQMNINAAGNSITFKTFANI